MSTSGAVSFSARQRVLPCEKCNAALIVPPEGGEVRCARCGTAQAVPQRPDTAVPPSPPTEELARRERLRPQDGRPMLPPPGTEQYLAGGVVPPHKLQEAMLVWGATRKQLAGAPADIAAAERLVFLTQLLVNTLVAARDDAGMRALIEGALEVLMLPRHRQAMRARLARMAAREGDLPSAEKWLAGCDPASEDLQADTAWRISRAFLDTAMRRPDAVLGVLGETFEAVPIDDSTDALATVLRANAFEQRGDVDGAKALLARFMTGGGGLSAAVEGVVGALPPDWGVCAQSLGAARGAARAEVGARAAGGGGGALLGYVLIVVGCIPAVMMLKFVIDGQFFGPMASMLIFPVVFGGWGLSMVRSARRAQAIARDGLRGRGRIVSVAATGTRINHVPVMRLDLELEVEGHGQRKASTKKLLPSGQAQMLVGREVSVLWHPKYPNDVVVDL